MTTQRRSTWRPGYWTTCYVVGCLTILLLIAIVELAW